jgi:hypothetical protein
MRFLDDLATRFFASRSSRVERSIHTILITCIVPICVAYLSLHYGIDISPDLNTWVWHLPFRHDVAYPVGWSELKLEVELLVSLIHLSFIQLVLDSYCRALAWYPNSSVVAINTAAVATTATAKMYLWLTIVDYYIAYLSIFELICFLLFIFTSTKADRIVIQKI